MANQVEVIGPRSKKQKTQTKNDVGRSGTKSCHTIIHQKVTESP